MWEAGIIVKGSEVALVPWKIGVLGAIALRGAVLQLCAGNDVRPSEDDMDKSEWALRQCLQCFGMRAAQH